MGKPRIGITLTDKPDDLAPRYIEALERAGADHVLVRPGSPVSAKEIDGLILSGGVNDIHPDHFREPLDPQTFDPDLARDRMELDLLADMRRQDKPVLGICRGFQLMNVGFGGKLIQHVDGHRSVNGVSGEHTLDVLPGTRLAGLLGAYGPIRTNSRHHQAVNTAYLAPGIKPSGYSPDGLVESIEATGQRWMMGFQCHPERAEEVDDRFANVFADFVKAADSK